MLQYPGFWDHGTRLLTQVLVSLLMEAQLSEERERSLATNHRQPALIIALPQIFLLNIRAFATYSPAKAAVLEEALEAGSSVRWD